VSSPGRRARARGYVLAASCAVRRDHRGHGLRGLARTRASSCRRHWGRGRGRGDAEPRAVRCAELGHARRAAARVPSVSVEAGVAQGWERWVDQVVSLERFGASAPGPSDGAARDHADAVVRLCGECVIAAGRGGAWACGRVSGGRVGAPCVECAMEAVYGTSGALVEMAAPRGAARDQTAELGTPRTPNPPHPRTPRNLTPSRHHPVVVHQARARSTRGSSSRRR